MIANTLFVSPRLMEERNLPSASKYFYGSYCIPNSTALGESALNVYRLIISYHESCCMLDLMRAERKPLLCVHAHIELQYAICSIIAHEVLRTGTPDSSIDTSMAFDSAHVWP